MRCEFVSTEFYRGIDESQRRNPRKRGPDQLNSLLSVRCPGSSERFPPSREQTNLRLASGADNQKEGEGDTHSPGGLFEENVNNSIIAKELRCFCHGKTCVSH